MVDCTEVKKVLEREAKHLHEHLKKKSPVALNLSTEE